MPLFGGKRRDGSNVQASTVPVRKAFQQNDALTTMEKKLDLYRLPFTRGANKKTVPIGEVKTCTVANCKRYPLSHQNFKTCCKACATSGGKKHDRGCHEKEVTDLSEPVEKLLRKTLATVLEDTAKDAQFVKVEYKKIIGYVEISNKLLHAQEYMWRTEPGQPAIIRQDRVPIVAEISPHAYKVGDLYQTVYFTHAHATRDRTQSERIDFPPMSIVMVKSVELDKANVGASLVECKFLGVPDPLRGTTIYSPNRISGKVWLQAAKMEEFILMKIDPFLVLACLELVRREQLTIGKYYKMKSQEVDAVKVLDDNGETVGEVKHGMVMQINDMNADATKALITLQRSKVKGWMAVMDGNQFLVEAVEDPETEDRAVIKKSLQEVAESIKNWDSSKIDALLQTSEGRQLLNTPDHNTTFMLHVAVKFGRQKIVEQMCSHEDIDVNVANGFGETPLHIAIQFSVDDNATDEGSTKLRLKLKVAMIEALIKAGAIVDAIDYKSRTALMHAAKFLPFGAVRCAKVLLDNNADQGSRTDKGKSVYTFLDKKITSPDVSEDKRKVARELRELLIERNGGQPVYDELESEEKNTSPPHTHHDDVAKEPSVQRESTPTKEENIDNAESGRRETTSIIKQDNRKRSTGKKSVVMKDSPEYEQEDAHMGAGLCDSVVYTHGTLGLLPDSTSVTGDNDEDSRRPAEQPFRPPRRKSQSTYIEDAILSMTPDTEENDEDLRKKVLEQSCRRLDDFRHEFEHTNEELLHRKSTTSLPSTHSTPRSPQQANKDFQGKINEALNESDPTKLQEVVADVESQHSQLTRRSVALATTAMHASKTELDALIFMEQQFAWGRWRDGVQVRFAVKMCQQFGATNGWVYKKAVEYLKGQQTLAWPKGLSENQESVCRKLKECTVKMDYVLRKQEPGNATAKYMSELLYALEVAEGENLDPRDVNHVHGRLSRYFKAIEASNRNHLAFCFPVKNDPNLPACPDVIKIEDETVEMSWGAEVFKLKIFSKEFDDLTDSVRMLTVSALHGYSSSFVSVGLTNAKVIRVVAQQIMLYFFQTRPGTHNFFKTLGDCKNYRFSMRMSVIRIAGDKVVDALVKPRPPLRDKLCKVDMRPDGEIIVRGLSERALSSEKDFQANMAAARRISGGAFAATDSHMIILIKIVRQHAEHKVEPPSISTIALVDVARYNEWSTAKQSTRNLALAMHHSQKGDDVPSKHEPFVKVLLSYLKQTIVCATLSTRADRLKETAEVLQFIPWISSGTNSGQNDDAQHSAPAKTTSKRHSRTKFRKK